MLGRFDNSNVGPLEILEEGDRMNIEMNYNWEFFTIEDLETYLQWVYQTKISTPTI